MATGSGPAGTLGDPPPDPPRDPPPGPAPRSFSTLPDRTLPQTPRPSPTPSGSELTTRPAGRSERTRGDYRPHWFHFEEKH